MADISAALVTAFTTLGTDVSDLAAKVIVPAVALMGLVFAIRYAKKIFGSIAGTRVG